MSSADVGDAFRALSLVMGGLFGAALISVTMAYVEQYRAARREGRPWRGLSPVPTATIVACITLLLWLVLRTTYRHIHEPFSIVNPVRCVAYGLGIYGLLAFKRWMKSEPR